MKSTLIGLTGVALVFYILGSCTGVAIWSLFNQTGEVM